MHRFITFALFGLGLASIAIGYQFDCTFAPSEPVIPFGLAIMGTLCIAYAWCNFERE